MTLKLVEGFDHMSTPTLFGTKGWSLTLDGGCTIVAGRINGNAMSLKAGGGTECSTQKTLPAALATFFFGFAFNLPAVGSAATIARVRAGATNTFQIQVNAAGRLTVLNSSGTVIATGTTILNTATWYFAELKGFVNGASGTCELHLNGASGEIASTVGNFGSTNVDSVQLVKSTVYSSGQPVLFDDIYVLDTSASPNNNFLGDVRVSALFPTGAGAHTDFTPDSGSNYARVNEASGTYPDGDTSYVSDATVGHRDSYVFGDLPSLTGTVFAVQTNLYARKDDASTRQIAAVARPGSTDRDGATVTLGTSYSDFTEIRETNPDTSAAWTISEVNASEFGVKVVA